MVIKNGRRAERDRRVAQLGLVIGALERTALGKDGVTQPLTIFRSPMVKPDPLFEANGISGKSVCPVRSRTYRRDVSGVSRSSWVALTPVGREAWLPKTSAFGLLHHARLSREAPDDEIFQGSHLERDRCW